MGFHDARRRLLDCLEEGCIGHWPRKDAYRKNWLQSGRMTVEHVRELLIRCNGTQYRQSVHDFDAETSVHEFFPDHGATHWYVKVFFDDHLGVAMFMSVHPSGEGNEDLEGR